MSKLDIEKKENRKIREKRGREARKMMPTRQQLTNSYINALHIEKMVSALPELKKYDKKIKNIKTTLFKCKTILYSNLVEKQGNTRND